MSGQQHSQCKGLGAAWNLVCSKLIKVGGQQSWTLQGLGGYGEGLGLIPGAPSHLLFPTTQGCWSFFPKCCPLSQPGQPEPGFGPLLT